MADGFHILYIDDDQTNLDSIRKMLGRQGYTVSTANTGNMGLQMVEAHPPDLVLLDILLPDTNGFEVCDAIRSQAHLRHIPILAITATYMDEKRQQSLAAGFDDYLPKPIARGDLLDAIEKYSGY